MIAVSNAEPDVTFAMVTAISGTEPGGSQEAKREPGGGMRMGMEAGRRWAGKQGGHRNGAGTERGSATIWMVGLMTLIFAVAAAVTFTGMARVARHRAQSAADLSALAAARLAFVDPNRGCAEASSLAVGNGAKVTRCFIDGDGIADVQVALRLLLPVAGGVTVMAGARAGPVHISDFAD